MPCSIHKKCNWCHKRKHDVVKIKMWCKYYNLNICNECYYIKINTN